MTGSNLQIAYINYRHCLVLFVQFIQFAECLGEFFLWLLLKDKLSYSQYNDYKQKQNSIYVLS